MFLVTKAMSFECTSYDRQGNPVDEGGIDVSFSLGIFLYDTLFCTVQGGAMKRKKYNSASTGAVSGLAA